MEKTKFNPHERNKLVMEVREKHWRKFFLIISFKSQNGRKK